MSAARDGKQTLSYRSPERDSAVDRGAENVQKAASLSTARALEMGLERSEPRNQLPRGAPIQLPFLATTLKVSEAELGTRPLKSSSVQARKASALRREDLLCVFELVNFILEPGEIPSLSSQSRPPLRSSNSSIPTGLPWGGKSSRGVSYPQSAKQSERLASESHLPAQPTVSFRTPPTCLDGRSLKSPAPEGGRSKTAPHTAALYQDTCAVRAVRANPH